MNKNINRGLLLTAILMVLNSCGEKAPAPAGKIKAQADGNIVQFSVEPENAESFEWDFGDGTQVSTEQNPVHIYTEFGKDYTVTLNITGPGGRTTLTETISIRPMTNMEIITGGQSDQDGRKWRIKHESAIYRAKADVNFTIVQTHSPGFLGELGFANACLDEYIFKYNGDYSICPKGNCVMAGLAYCNARKIPHTPPSQQAAMLGLTQTDSFSPVTGLKFALNESKDLIVKISDGSTTADITIPDVMTITFSKGGFLGLNNWLTECVVLSISDSEMRVAFFTSDIAAESPQAGKTNGALILTFELVE